MLLCAQSIERQHEIIVVTVYFGIANGQKERKINWLCHKRGGKYKNQIFSQGTCSGRVKCPFTLKYMPNNNNLNVTVRCNIHNYELAKNLVGHNILSHVKPRERQFVNGITK